MKYVFLGIFLALVAWSVWAVALLPARSTKLIWVTDNNPARELQRKAFQQWYADRHDSKPLDVQIDYNNRDLTKIIVQAQSRIGGDVIDMHDIGNMHDLVKMGVLEAIDPAFAKEHHLDPGSTWPAVAKLLDIGGKQYAIPANAYTDVMFWNRRILREAGVALPLPREMTWDDYRAIARQVQQHYAGRRDAPFMLPRIGYDGSVLLIWQCGGWIFNQTQTRCTLNTPEVRRAWQMYYDLIHKDHIMPTQAQADALTSAGGWGFDQAMFESGRVVSLIIGRWAVNRFRAAQYQTAEGNFVMNGPAARVLPEPLEYEVTFIPVDPARREKVWPVSVRLVGISAYAPSPKLAHEFAAFLGSDEYSRLIDREADALPPHPDQAAPFNPKYPLETSQINDTFAAAMQFGRPLEISPFVSHGDVWRIMDTALTRLVNGSETVESALAEAERQVNQLIDESRRDNPKLDQLWRERWREQEEIESGKRPDPRAAAPFVVPALAGREQSRLKPELRTNAAEAP